MKVFVAGGTGVIGRNLLPLLAEPGHEVIALVRSKEKAGVVEQLGAKAVVADALDRDALGQAIRKVEPEVIIHQLTSHNGLANFKRLDDDFRVTNRLRTESMATIMDAARDVGTRRVIAQSFCGWPFARDGNLIKTEEDPLDPSPPKSFRNTMSAIKALEDSVQGDETIHGIALRYGFLYGPGTSIASDGELVAMIRRRQFPIVGNGAGIWSFTHVYDAAQAAVSALTHGATGVYNVVDDEPAAVGQWLPFLAECVGAKPPRRVPVWLARSVLGPGGIAMMTDVRGGSNSKAKQVLGWSPSFTSWRQGFLKILD